MQKVPNSGPTKPQENVWEEQFEPLPVRWLSEYAMPKAMEICPLMLLRANCWSTADWGNIKIPPHWVLASTDIPLFTPGKISLPGALTDFFRNRFALKSIGMTDLARHPISGYVIQQPDCQSRREQRTLKQQIWMVWQTPQNVHQKPEYICIPSSSWPVWGNENPEFLHTQSDEAGGRTFRVGKTYIWQNQSHWVTNASTKGHRVLIRDMNLSTLWLNLKAREAAFTSSISNHSPGPSCWQPRRSVCKISTPGICTADRTRTWRSA